MKPETPVTISWGASTTKSGTLSAYELRYTTNNGSSYTTVSTSLSTTNRTYTFTPNVRTDDILQIEICARNSYNKKSGYGKYAQITIYADGASIAQVSSTRLDDVRAYVKTGGAIHKIKYIKVKQNGVIYNIDQYAAPQD